MNVEERSIVRRAAQTVKLAVETVGQVIRSMNAAATETGHAIKVRDLEGLMQELERALQDLEEAATEEIAGLGDEQRQELRDALREVYNESRKVNWDGYGARAASPRAYREALRFCALLPSSVPVPEVAADPDGEFAFEWTEGPGNVFSVSVGCDHKLTYAGIFGKNRVHGVEYFGNECPPAILREINRLYTEAKAQASHDS